MSHARLRDGRECVRRRARGIAIAVACVAEMLELRTLLSGTVSSISGLAGFTLNGANGAGIYGSSTQDNNDGTAPTLSSNNATLTLTTQINNEASSAFYNTPATFQNFTAAFTYAEQGGSPADGFTFTLENDSRGVHALGGGGDDLGYATDGSHPATAISPSFAVEFNINAGSHNGDATDGGQTTNGATFGSVNLTGGDPVNVSISYNSTTQQIYEALTDPTTKATYYTSYSSVNLPTILAGSSAYVGFTGATGGLNALQAISNFSFSTHASPPPPPPPGSIAGFTGFSLNAANGAGIDGSATQDNNHGAAPTLSGDSNTLTLTTTSANEASSAFYGSQVPYQDFTANFTYTETQGSPPADGFTFTVEDDSRGAKTLGGGGGDFGYSTDSNHPATAIGDSFAIEFNINSGSLTGDATAGAGMNNAAQTGAVTLTSGDAISITLAYNSSTLTETLTDTRTNATFSTTYTGINLPALLGSNTAYVGFTGGTSGAGALQSISNFSFEPNSTVPPPPPPPGTIAGFGGFVLNGANGAGIDGSATQDNNNGAAPILSTNGSTLTLTTAANNEASSAFYNVPVTYQNFTASFTYTDTQGNPPADGFTFTLEDDARGAYLIGSGGGDLGYSSGSEQPATAIAPSFAAEFNVYQGSDVSLGAAGTIGTTTASNTGSVNLASGDPINIFLAYNSSTQTFSESLKDSKNSATFTTIYNGVNVPALVGSNTAYIGFTGGTGGADSLQTISNFVYTNAGTASPPTLSAAAFGQFSLNAGSGNAAGVPSVSADGNTLTLTTTSANEGASAFDPTPVYYNNFQASFTYTDLSGSGSSGFTFTLQNDIRSAAALGAGGADLGYAAASGGPAAITPSLSLQFNVSTSSTSGEATDGALATTTTTGSVNLASGDPIHVNLVYSTTALTLTETLTDTKTEAIFSQTFSNVNIAQLFGQQSALVGFHGGNDGGRAADNQQFQL